MNRREAISMLGATAAGLTAMTITEARADEHQMAHEQFEKCAKACADCQLHCDSCFHHCAELAAKGEAVQARTQALQTQPPATIP